MLSGTLNEIRYEWPENKEIVPENDESMKILSEDQISTDDVNYINGRKMIQTMSNSSLKKIDKILSKFK